MKLKELLEAVEETLDTLHTVKAREIPVIIRRDGVEYDEIEIKLDDYTDSRGQRGTALILEIS